MEDSIRMSVIGVGYVDPFSQGDTCEALIKAVEELKAPLKPLLKAPFGRFRQ